MGIRNRPTENSKEKTEKRTAAKLEEQTEESENGRKRGAMKKGKERWERGGGKSNAMKEGK